VGRQEAVSKVTTCPFFGDWNSTQRKKRKRKKRVEFLKVRTIRDYWTGERLRERRQEA
jgi:hypothetical protein